MRSRWSEENCMGRLVKATTERCQRCVYHQGVGSQPGKEQTNGNICCNYLGTTGHSRIFVNGEPAYDPKYCNKFETGKKKRTGQWNRDNMTMWQHKCKKKEEARKHELDYEIWF